MEAIQNHSVRTRETDTSETPPFQIRTEPIPPKTSRGRSVYGKECVGRFESDGITLRGASFETLILLSLSIDICQYTKNLHLLGFQQHY